MLFSKKLLMGERNPMLFVFPIITSSGRRIEFKDYYATRDGKTLTHYTFPESRNWIRPAFGRGKYVIAAPNGAITEIYVSTNAMNWSRSATISVGTPGRLVFANGAYYLFTTSTGAIYKSTDAITWSSVGTAPTIHSSLYLNSCGIAYKNGTWVVGSYNMQTLKVDLYYSTNDCSSWTQTSINYTGPSAARTGVGGIIAVDNGFELEVHGTSDPRTVPYTRKFFYSADGVTWAESSFSLTGGYQGLGVVGNESVGCLVDTLSSGYKSTGGGVWTSISLKPMTLSDAHTDINNKYFCVGSFDNGVFTTYWHNLEDGSVGSSATAMVSPTSSSSYVYYYSFSRGAF